MGWVDAVIPVIIALIAPIPTSNWNYLPLEPARLTRYIPIRAIHYVYPPPRSLLSRIHRCTKIGNRTRIPSYSFHFRYYESSPPYFPPFVSPPRYDTFDRTPTNRFHARFLTPPFPCKDNSLARERWNNINSSSETTIFFHEACATIELVLRPKQPTL